MRRALDDFYEVANTLDSMGHPLAALGQHDQARAAWQEALKLCREQGRDDDAERVQQQLGNLTSASESNSNTPSGAAAATEEA